MLLYYTIKCGIIIVYRLIKGCETVISAITSTLNAIWGVFRTIGINDIVDIIILYFIVYNGIKLIRETRAQQLTKGILVLVGAYVLSVIFSLKTMRFLLKLCFQWGFVALIILFQPELRRMLEKVGRTKIAELSFLNPTVATEDEEKWGSAIEAVCDACQNLSSTKTGALIIFERKTKLGEQIATGTILNCTPSAAVFGNIFFPNTPLHDGAVIIRDGVILAAGCFLPRPQKDELINKELGSRHRAAIGMSENSDALVIVVSEETGAISVADNGELTRGYTKDSLKKLLSEAFMPDRDVASAKENSFAGRVISKWKK
ncbi:MAG: diadenylate cyclase CdaA [Ruminococcus sp.]|nr:diadenylate cyclase CdaA [Ruminococcus sp.]